MSARLDKARAALHDAKKQDHNDNLQQHLLEIARTQAAIAAAEALEELVRWCKLTATGQDDERKQAQVTLRLTSGVGAERAAHKSTETPSERTWYGD